MTNDLVTRIRNVFADTPQIMTWFNEDTYAAAEARAHISGMWEALKEAADYIEHLERELGEERYSREVASAKGWEFSDRIKRLEKALTPLAEKHLYPDDLGEFFAIEARSDDDWDEERNDKQVDDVWIERGWVRAARAVLKGETK